MDNENTIVKLQLELTTAQAEAKKWEDLFHRLVKTIMTHMEERFVISNQAYAYRKVLFEVLTEKGYSEEDAQDFTRLSRSEVFLQERIKHFNTVR